MNLESEVSEAQIEVNVVESMITEPQIVVNTARFTIEDELEEESK